MSNDPQNTNLPSAETETLLFQTSPFGNLDAIVEHDGRAVYFYLNGNVSGNRFGTRACWVRNLIPGPYVLNTDEMREGRPPLLPRTHCKYSDGRPLPDAGRLEIIWLEEGNGAALVERKEVEPDEPGSIDPDPEVLAVIPPWSGLEEFHGYARDCATECPLCWPMPDNPRLNRRITRAAEFWSTFTEPPEANLFAGLQKSRLESYAKFFPEFSATQENSYFAIDGGNFPPRGMIVVESENVLTALTVGMSLCPQPAVELFSDSPSELRRIELGIRISGKKITAEDRELLFRQLSGLAAMPWNTWTWLGPGHTTSFDSFRAVYGDQTGFGLLVPAATRDSAKIPELIAETVRQFSTEAPEVVLPPFREDPVHLLWLVPVTEAQRAQLAAEPSD